MAELQKGRQWSRPSGELLLPEVLTPMRGERPNSPGILHGCRVRAYPLVDLVSGSDWVLCAGYPVRVRLVPE